MIQVRNLSKFYGEKRAITGLNFQLEKGQIAGLLGRNGAGKTTTIRILTGYLIPSSGDARIDGKSIFDNPLEAKRNIGYLPETPPLYEDLSVWDYLSFVSKIKQVTPDKSNGEIEKVIERTNLQNMKSRLISTLSLGFRKRVGIAQAILGNPSIVIMDEPISGLDPQQIIEMRSLIRSLAGDHTVLISSHILGEIYKTCDKFLFLQEGQLRYDYNRSELEKEMNRISNLEVQLSGGNLDTEKVFLESIALGMDGIMIQSSGEGAFLISTPSPEARDGFRKTLLNKISDSSFQLELLRRQEVSLEQIFMEKV